MNRGNEMPVKVQKACRTNKFDHQRKFPWHIIIKTLKTQNKKRILKAAKGKDQVTYKGRPVRITPYQQFLLL